MTHPAKLPVRLYSTEDAASVLGISRSGLYREMREGRLPSVKVGRRRMVTVEAIEAWLAALPAAR